MPEGRSTSSRSVGAAAAYSKTHKGGGGRRRGVRFEHAESGQPRHVAAARGDRDNAFDKGH